MNNPTIPGEKRRRKVFSTAAALDTIGNAIGCIKHRDALTWDDVGAAFNKSADVAASYRNGLSDMPLTAFLRGIDALGPDLANAALSTIGYKVTPIDDAGHTSDADKLAPIARAVAMVAECTSDASPGGATITSKQLIDNRKPIEDLWCAARELRDELDLAIVTRFTA